MDYVSGKSAMDERVKGRFHFLAISFYIVDRSSTHSSVDEIIEIFILITL